MTLETISVRLPQGVYQRLRQRADTMNRPIDVELAEVVEEALGHADAWGGISEETVDAVEQLRFLNEADLWQAARMEVPAESSERMQVLILKLQAEGLGDAELHEAEQLSRLAERVMLVRAEAAALLKARGQDISILHPPTA
jgi:hypothetical protein